MLKAVISKPFARFQPR